MVAIYLAYGMDHYYLFILACLQLYVINFGYRRYMKFQNAVTLSDSQ